MTIDKNITVDLNRVQPLKTIQIHEGDTNSVRLVFTLTKDSADVDLSSVSIRYDAVIGDYLAEQDAPGSIEDGKAVVPVTANMTARSGHQRRYHHRYFRHHNRPEARSTDAAV